MKKRQIINIINFIRGIEPREDIDLVKPVREQILLMKKHHFKGTFLIQYDALCNPIYTDLLRELDVNQFELGIWFEVVQPLAEKAGIPWKGRYPWDWHAHCGFSVGYTIEERKTMIDIFFQDFKACFGFTPKSFGSWAFDAYTLDYASKEYGLDAACNCKDQWGTDGYTMWGGYYGQGYYPSRMNVFCPAGTLENQIETPVFRMLGSDPIYQYDLGLSEDKTATSFQGVASLEPVYKDGAGGGVPQWVDWYLAENFSGNCLTFGYAQAGQENSFGWESMKDGLEDQFEKFARLAADGNLEIETLGETGRWYKKTFAQTPPSSIAALSDWQDCGRRSIWYNCKNYRVNLYAENGRFWIRDIYLFREDYRERYLDNVCTENELTYDNLPIVDGNRFSGSGIRSGMYPSVGEESIAQGMPYIDLVYQEISGNAVVTFTGTPCGDVTFTLTENGINIQKTSDTPLRLVSVQHEGAPNFPEIRQASDKEIELCYRGYHYHVKVSKGTVVDQNTICSEGNEIAILLNETFCACSGGNAQ